MGLTVTKVRGTSEQVLGKVRGVMCDVAADNSYVTGGEACTADLFGLKRLLAVQDLNTPTTAGGTGKQYEFDVTNAKLKILVSAAAGSALQEVANASDQSGVTRRVLALGY